MARGKSSLTDDGAFPKPKLVNETQPPPLRLPVEEFITGPDDEKGHTARVEVPKRGLAMRVIGMIEDGKFPRYRSSHDFIRDAVYHRAYELFNAYPEAFDPDVAELFAHAKAMTAYLSLQDAAARHKQFSDMLDDILARIDELPKFETRKQLGVINAQIGKLPYHRQGELRDKMNVLHNKLRSELDTPPEA